MIEFRSLSIDELEFLQELVAAAPPLDRHTPYTYWVLLRFFPDTCLLAEQEGQQAGFVTALPDAKGGLFIWQIGVLPAFRGGGVGMRLLHELLRRFPQVRKLLFTVAPDNRTSLGLFTRFAEESGAQLELVEGIPLGENLMQISLPNSI